MIKLRLTGFFVAFFLAANPTFADKAPTIDQLLEMVGESNSRAKLDKGGILWGGSKKNEANTASLAGYMVARVDGNIPDIIKFLNTSPKMPSVKIYPIDDSTDESLLASLKPVVYTKDDGKDVKMLVKPKQSAKFNYSNEEIAALKTFMAAYEAGSTPYKNDEEAAAAGLRNLMAERYRAYRKSGLNGIAPYQRSDTKQDDPAQQFRNAMGVIPNAEKYWPDFMAALSKYPQVADDSPYQNVFSLMIEEAEGRVLYTMNHAMIEEADDYALIMQREFYLSHTLEILAIITLMVQDGDETVVAILAQTATDMVAGVARPIAGPIGRTVMSYNLKPLFKVLQKEFGK